MEKKEQKELKEIRGLVLELSQKLKDVGIPVSDKVDNVVINTRAKSRFGACKVNKKMLGKSYTIEVSSEILACKREDIETILIHELLHTCNGCFNHGKKWKLYSHRVEESLGYKITRTQNYETLGLAKPKEKEHIKYMVKCSGCGQEFPRKRMCQLVKTPERYKCGKCGNILYLVDKNNHI